MLNWNNTTLEHRARIQKLSRNTPTCIQDSQRRAASGCINMTSSSTPCYAGPATERSALIPVS